MLSAFKEELCYETEKRELPPAKRRGAVRCCCLDRTCTHEDANFCNEDGPIKANPKIILNFHVCNGLTNQRMALLDGLLLGLLLGAQVRMRATIPSNGNEFLPRGAKYEKSVEDLFNMPLFVHELKKVYVDYWCERRHKPESDLWCSQSGDSEWEPFLLVKPKLDKPPAGFGSTSLHELAQKKGGHYLSLGTKQIDRIRERILAHHRDTFIEAGCPLFALAVKEDSESDIWGLFWRLNDVLQFSNPIIEAGEKIISHIRDSSLKAQTRAQSFGYSVTSEDSAQPYTVLHLRAEKDWQMHCARWMNPYPTRSDRAVRDNCMNNTMEIVNVLISEGVIPTRPVYICTGLTPDEFENLRLSGMSNAITLKDLSNRYTTVFKEHVFGKEPKSSKSVHEEREFWAAVDYYVAERSEVFVGNSVSTFSAFLLVERQRRNAAAFHYNGGNVPLVDAGWLTPRLPLSEAFQYPMKWVFTIHEGSSVLNRRFLSSVKVAVTSARFRTSLIPICVTTSLPTSTLSKWLVKNGVRVINHVPWWAEEMKDRIQGLNALSASEERIRAAPSHLSNDPHAMIGTFLRVDIPILGFIDQFMLYTDVDVMFAKGVSWLQVLGSLKTPHHKNYAKPGSFGVPEYFGASCETQKTTDPNNFNAGVMLMNMRNLRDTHDEFMKFIFKSPDFNWKTGPGDQGAYKEFYRVRGTTQATLLPFELNWKTYWEHSDDATLIHFHGPKCSDIMEYIKDNKTTYPIFQPLLDFCTAGGDCVARCRQYSEYLKMVGEKPEDANEAHEKQNVTTATSFQPSTSNSRSGIDSQMAFTQILALLGLAFFVFFLYRGRASKEKCGVYAKQFYLFLKARARDTLEYTQRYT